MTKDFGLILFEGTVVGIGLIAVYKLVEMMASSYSLSQNVVLLLSGLLFHLLCEFTGVNQWYSLKYCDLLKNDKK